MDEQSVRQSLERINTTLGVEKCQRSFVERLRSLCAIIVLGVWGYLLIAGFLVSVGVGVGVALFMLLVWTVRKSD